MPRRWTKLQFTQRCRRKQTTTQRQAERGGDLRGAQEGSGAGNPQHEVVPGGEAGPRPELPGGGVVRPSGNGAGGGGGILPGGGAIDSGGTVPGQPAGMHSLGSAGSVPAIEPAERPAGDKSVGRVESGPRSVAHPEPAGIAAAESDREDAADQRSRLRVTRLELDNNSAEPEPEEVGEGNSSYVYFRAGSNYASGHGEAAKPRAHREAPRRAAARSGP